MIIQRILLKRFPNFKLKSNTTSYLYIWICPGSKINSNVSEWYVMLIKQLSRYAKQKKKMKYKTNIQNIIYDYVSQ